MPPTNQVLVFSPPCCLLVLCIARDAHRTKFSDRQILYSTRLRAHQHDGPAYFFSLIIAQLGSFADVHKPCNCMPAPTVLGQDYGLCFVTLVHNYRASDTVRKDLGICW